jgi:hypothetical protein
LLQASKVIEGQIGLTNGYKLLGHVSRFAILIIIAIKHQSNNILMIHGNRKYR